MNALKIAAGDAGRDSFRDARVIFLFGAALLRRDRDHDAGTRRQHHSVQYPTCKVYLFKQ
ncbi:hypothetical protein [Pseudomonas sp. GM55]|uniref:hypothetical protein n=1 Tax=Pseudomonas sp. GM55 TaxID=1144333 RepID=UPI0005B90A78|nr:hypothetical protein [Pseudomonas sp. GM55]